MLSPSAGHYSVCFGADMETNYRMMTLGAEDLWILLQNVSLAPSGIEKKMRLIETWAPWLSDDEAQERIEFLKLLTTYERTPTARDLGERLRLTNAERERDRLWPIKPFDMTDEELAEQRKSKSRERRMRDPANEGRPSRAIYLASSRAVSARGRLSASNEGLGRGVVSCKTAQSRPGAASPELAALSFHQSRGRANNIL
jgi:hypothetical protein